MKESYGTLVETINGLKKDGYTLDFNVSQSQIIYTGADEKFSPDDFKIDKVYRFEGPSNPDDQAILYAISALNSDRKGTLVNGYGISAESEIDDLITKLQTHPDVEEQHDISQ